MLLIVVFSNKSVQVNILSWAVAFSSPFVFLSSEDQLHHSTLENKFIKRSRVQIIRKHPDELHVSSYLSLSFAIVADKSHSGLLSCAYGSSKMGSGSKVTPVRQSSGHLSTLSVVV